MFVRVFVSAVMSDLLHMGEDGEIIKLIRFGMPMYASVQSITCATYRSNSIRRTQNCGINCVRVGMGGGGDTHFAAGQYLFFLLERPTR